MKCVYQAADTLEAHLVLGLLEQHRIQGFIEGAHLTGGLGELPVQNYVRVLVNDIDYEAGRRLMLEYDQANAITDPLPQPVFRHWGWFVLALLAIIAAESLRFL
jgi:hypothetical protein